MKLQESMLQKFQQTIRNAGHHMRNDNSTNLDFWYWAMNCKWDNSLRQYVGTTFREDYSAIKSFFPEIDWKWIRKQLQTL